MTEMILIGAYQSGRFYRWIHFYVRRPFFVQEYKRCMKTADDPVLYAGQPGRVVSNDSYSDVIPNEVPYRGLQMTDHRF